MREKMTDFPARFRGRINSSGFSRVRGTRRAGSTTHRLANLYSNALITKNAPFLWHGLRKDMFFIYTCVGEVVFGGVR